MIKVSTRDEAWELVKLIFPGQYGKSDVKSKSAGYPVYVGLGDCDEMWISDLNSRIELNMGDKGSYSLNIYIEPESKKFKINDDLYKTIYLHLTNEVETSLEKFEEFAFTIASYACNGSLPTPDEKEKFHWLNAKKIDAERELAIFLNTFEEPQ